ncbi:ECF transporter S component [Vallitalea sp.]|jgi:ECF transporter S component (folate family)|uniref:ECF transporter S component n=1 Tax=Vallitalea sp. TaxID=1882829 RepID=UPI0025F9EDCC|nr:ECF transporter S component [Vallitalea sp.]MCT4687646.1 ECF transporter S component [Vallitalea sp.]
MNRSKSSYYVKVIVQTGLLIAIAQIVKMFSTYLYFAGAPAIRISFSGPFTKMPGILFGPVVGGISAGLSDIIGYLIKPQGAYIPWLTVTSILGGVLTPLIWKGLRNIEIRKLQTICIIVFSVIGLLGIFNHIQLTYYGTGTWAKYISSIGKTTTFATVLLIATSLVGFLLLLIDRIIQKSYNQLNIYNNFLKLIISVGIPGLLVTTINTQLLRIFIPVLSKKAFMAFLLPRIVEELFMTVYISYMLSLLLYLYNNLFKNK